MTDETEPKHEEGTSERFGREEGEKESKNEEEQEEKDEEIQQRVGSELRMDEEAWKDATAGKPDSVVEQMARNSMNKTFLAIRELRQLDQQLANERARADAELAEKEASVVSLHASLLSLITETARNARDTHGKPLPEGKLEEHKSRASELEAELEKERTKAVKLRATLRSIESGIRRREQARDGLHVIDFEQLKIENQTFAEKIEARNEELAKLRRKIDSTIQVLTHIKEKLVFVHGETEAMQERLADVDSKVLLARDVLASSKQERDSLRSSNVRLQQQSGLVGAADLLRDYEENRQALEESLARLDHLRRTYSNLTGNPPSSSQNSPVNAETAVKLPTITQPTSSPASR